MEAMRMSFSERTNWNLGENEWTAAMRVRRASGAEVIDLTVSNPTACGFVYDVNRLLAPLSDPKALRYEPDPLGMVQAREAVVRYYQDVGASIPMEAICLTTSTSEAYSFLFRLLCLPGDEVLVGRPSYPLFDFLARIDDVVLRDYPLVYDPAGREHSWSIDIHALEAAIGPRTRAVIVVHPNNPTGNFASEWERSALEIICAERGLALIVDEVFLDYGLEPRNRSFAAGQMGCLTFVLSGISKVCALPQMKVSWISARGPSNLVHEAMERLEVIADTFLSMNAPMQFALTTWLEARADIQQQILGRMRSNLASLDVALSGTSVERLAMQGGWTAVLRVPKVGSDFAMAALKCGVLVQPGEFYGLPAARVVVSLLTPQDIWARGISLLPFE
jgi:aspartate/methionine/tyrosine aminotransferase